MLCYRFYNFPSCRNSGWRCSVRKVVLKNFTKFTEKHLWHSLFFSSCTLHVEATASDLSPVMSWRFLDYFISTEKWNEKKEIPWWRKGNTKDFKGNLTEIWSKNVFKISEYPFKQNRNILKTWKWYYIHIFIISP